MPPRKINKSVEKQAITVPIEIVPYFAARSSDPRLSGQYGVGPTPELALTNFRSVVYRVYDHEHYDVEEQVDPR